MPVQAAISGELVSVSSSLSERLQPERGEEAPARAANQHVHVASLVATGMRTQRSQSSSEARATQPGRQPGCTGREALL